MAERYDEQVLLDYLEGDLSTDQAAEFERQLENDTKLRSLVGQLLADRDALRRLPTQPAPPQVMERVEQQLERAMLLKPDMAAQGPAPVPVHLRLAPYLTYAAVAAMILIAAGLVLRTLVDEEVLRAAKGKPRQVAMGGAAAEESEAVRQAAKDRGGTSLDRALRIAEARKEKGDPLANLPVAPAAPSASPSAVSSSAAAARSRENGGTESSDARTTAGASIADAEQRKDDALVAGGLASNVLPAPEKKLSADQVDKQSASASPAPASSSLASLDHPAESTVPSLGKTKNSAANETTMKVTTAGRRAAASPHYASQAPGGALLTEQQQAFASPRGPSQPELTRSDIKVTTADLARTSQEIEQWIKANHATALPVEQLNEAAGEANRLEGAVAAEQPIAAAKEQPRYLLLMRNSAVAMLLAQLSSQPNQIARLSLPLADSPARSKAIQAAQRVAAPFLPQITGQPSPQASGDTTDASRANASEPAAQSQSPAQAGAAGGAAGGADAAADESDPWVILPVWIDEVKP
jgi:hypothetical protein